MLATINPTLQKMATSRVWGDAGAEKAAFQPPMPPMDPAAAGGAPPPADPAMAGGAPGMPPGAPPGAALPMDPAMAGGMAGGAPPPMDPSMGAGGMPPMDPNMAAMGMGPGGQKIKPEQWMQALDFRLYNLQQQITALLNQAGASVPPGALITPPGMPAAPQPEAAMPGGPQDPSQQAGAEQGGGGSEINAIDPMGAASPELAQQGGKMAAMDPLMIADPELLPAGHSRKEEVTEFFKDANANAPEGYRIMLVKGAATGEGYRGSVDEEKPPTTSSPPKPLPGPHPGKTPSLTGPPTSGGSKDPKSRTEAGDDMGPANAEKSARQFAESLASDPARSDSFIGEPVARDLAGTSINDGVAAVAALYRSRAGVGT